MREKAEGFLFPIIRFYRKLAVPSTKVALVNMRAMPVVAFMVSPPYHFLLLASLLSAHGAAADKVHDGQQDNGP